MGTLVIILLVVFALLYRYKRQNQLYTRIVCQHQEAIRKEQQLREVIISLRAQQESVSASSPMSEKYAASSLTNEKRIHCFSVWKSLCRKMRCIKRIF